MLPAKHRSYGRRRSPANTRASAFTLIELLVSISIIAVLVSLLLPALSRAKGPGKSIKCRSNLRQLGVELQIYVDDFHAYPALLEETNIVPFHQLAISTEWFQPEEEKGIQRCPTFNPSRLQFSGSAGYIFGFGSYGYNLFGYSRAQGGHFGLGGVPYSDEGGNGWRHVKADGVRVPSEMIALGDRLALSVKTGTDLPADIVTESLYGLERDETEIGPRIKWARGSAKRAAARHGEQANITFCDGHVAAMSFRRLFLDRDDDSLRRWNVDNQPHR